MTVVVGTAGHIDHGKTALLRALTGIDADRLPEERRRGMTIDVGYAHLTLPGEQRDGIPAELDFVDVPGHDRLVGNMLVGAGEIDAAMLVVAADEGPKAQTLEHLGLLDALGIEDGVAVLTKLDLLDPTDPRRLRRPDEVRALLAPTSLANVQVVPVSAVSGEGLDALLAALGALAARVERHEARRGGPRLGVDRVFGARGRGVVVTGSLRGGAVSRGQALRLEPGGRSVRIREAQVHGRPVDVTPASGRVALNLAGVERDAIARGMALVAGPAVRATTRLLVALRPSPRARPLRDGDTVRVHLGTAQVLGRLRLARTDPARANASDAAATRTDDPPAVADGRAGDADEWVGALVLAEPIPAALDDRFVLRWPSPAETLAGGRVIDPAPPPRLVRRRLDGAKLRALVGSREPTARFAALVAAHGVIERDEAEGVAAILGLPLASLSTGAAVPAGHGRIMAPDVAAAGSAAAREAVNAALAADPTLPGVPLTVARSAAMLAMRRAAPGSGLLADDAAAVIGDLVEAGVLVRDADLVRDPGFVPARPSALRTAMDRLVPLLAVPAPPSLVEAARSAGCPSEGVRALETEGRIVRLEPDLAYAAETFRGLEAEAVALARSGPLTPAAFRDATGTSRRYALAILEELDSRGVLRRTPDGHVLGPRARTKP